MPKADFKTMLWCFFGFKGRLSREPYVLALLFSVFVVGLAIVPFIVVDEEGLVTFADGALPMVLLVIVIQFSITVKRLHDMGRSGFFALVLFVPLFSLLFTIIIAFIPGSNGSNRYGDQPNAPPA